MRIYVYIIIITFIIALIAELTNHKNITLNDIILFKRTPKKSKKQEEIEFKEYKRKVERERREAEERAEYLKKQGEINEARRKRILQEQLEKQEREERYERLIRQREESIAEDRIKFKETVDSIPEYKITLSGERKNRNKQLDIEDKEYKSIIKSTSLKSIKDFIAFDTETTGLKTGGNDVIQLSAIKFKNFLPVEKFNTYIKPRKPIPEEITDINGITDEMVENAPKFYQVIDSFNDFIEDLPLVAHNAPFDVKHLYVNGLDSIKDKAIYDTLQLSRKFLKGKSSYKLADICESAQVFISDAHNAVYDSFAAGKLFIYIIATKKEISVNELLEIVNGESEDTISC